MAPPPKGGFAVRPLDLALVAIGLVVVILIVWFSVGNNGSSQNVAQVPGAPAPTQDPNKPLPLPAGVLAPDFSLPSSDGKTFSLSQFRGKVVMLELFAPWCPHCQADAPIINQVYDKYKDKGVQVLMVSASPWSHTLEDDQAAQKTPTPISMSDITWFRDTFGVVFPILFDKDLNVAEKYGLAYYPTIYIIDKEGKIASNPAGNFVWENNKPVAQPEEDLSVDFLSRKLDQVLK
jgi:peroxiredoxin